MKVFCLSLSLFALISCANNPKEKIEVIREGPFIVHARSVDGKREGKTEIFDSLGKLSGVTNYKDDRLSGVCIHYFSNGTISDSVHYEYDKPQGYWKHYNQEGALRHITYFYFGLQFGPDIWYQPDQDKVLKSFTFLDFERRPVLECSFNTHGNLESIDRFEMPMTLEQKEKDGTHLVQFFAYLPEIPLVRHTYSIGVADTNRNKKELGVIKGSNFFIDTLLPAPPPGYHFYLSCHLQSQDGAVDKTVVGEAK